MIPVQVTLQYVKDNTKETRWVKLAMNETVGQALTKLIADLGLPTQDTLGRPLNHQLVYQRYVLDEQKALHEVGVTEGTILQLITVDANATVGINIGNVLAGTMLDRIGGKVSTELLTVSAVFANTAGRVVFQLRRSRALIGRADPERGIPAEMLDGDLTEIDTRRTVSRPHALVVYADDEFTIRDLYSQHGLYVNGTRLSPNMSHPLQNGDTVRFGEIELRFHRE